MLDFYDLAKENVQCFVEVEDLLVYNLWHIRLGQASI